MNQTSIQIDPEFEQFIPPLLPEELKQLEENILKDGAILNPLILWNGILVDGHNRYRIAQKHPEISYTTIERKFPDRYAALAWICRNQLGRRNLNKNQRSYLIGRQYMAEHMGCGGLRNHNRSKSGKFTTEVQNEHVWSEQSTRDRIAKEHNVSPSTVYRAIDFAKAVDIGEEVSPGFREDVLSCTIKPTRRDMSAIVQAAPEEQLTMVEHAKAPRPKKLSPENALVRRIGEEMEYTRGDGGLEAMFCELKDAAESLKFRWEMCLETYAHYRKNPENLTQIDALLDDLLDFLNQVKEENQHLVAS